ncbi:MAG: NADH:flavin oxidoreductase [Oxalobacter sp.]|nr:NADH:flavin oxidoreductase [Oxalobacter sp.]
MKKLFETARLGNLILKNRLVRSATWEGLALPDGGITDQTYEIYRELAKGGVGAIITGFTSVADNDQYFGGMMRLSHDGLIPQYRRLTELIHQENCPVIAQIALGGFYRGKTLIEPDAMTGEEIREVIGLFVDAARRAKDAGFDGVQVHAAHFFFLSRFISPAVNHRSDDWGGSMENRIRILFEIIKGIRETVPGIHLTAKVNCSDFTYRGLEEPESLAVCKALAEAGIDSIEVSGNGTSVQGIRAGINEGYFAGFASMLARQVDIPVIAVGGWRSLKCMESALNETRIEFLSLSRPLIREPDLPGKMLRGESTVSQCVSCNACYATPSHRCIWLSVE